MQGIARTIKDYLEAKCECEFGTKEPICAWIVEYAGVLLTLFSKGEPKDGKTPYERLTGRTWRIALPSFGETLHYKLRTPHKFMRRFDTGIYIDLKLLTSKRSSLNSTVRCMSYNQ